MTDENDLTALQTIVEDRATAATMLEQLEGVEEEHHDAGNGVPLRWQIELEVNEEDLPAIRRELREYIENGTF